MERTFATARSIEFDAVVIADGAPQQQDVRSVVLLQEAFRHLKAFGSWGDGAAVLTAAGIDVAGVFTGLDRCYHQRCDDLDNVDADLTADVAAATGLTLLRQR